MCVSRCLSRHLTSEHHARDLTHSEGVDYDTLSDEKKDGYVGRAMQDAARNGWASMTDTDRAAGTSHSVGVLRCVRETQTATVVTHHEGEEDIWRVALVMNPGRLRHKSTTSSQCPWSWVVGRNTNVFYRS